MRTKPLTRTTALIVFTAVIFGTAASCNPGQSESAIQLTRGAASKVFGSLGRETGEIKAATSVVPDLAARYGASADEVAAVAATADNYQGWRLPQQRIDRMVAAAENAKDNAAVSAGVDVACDWMAGDISTPDAFNESVAAAAAGMLQSDADAFRDATVDLADDLAEIKAEGSPADKAAAVWLCYAYGVVPAG
ncbi:hypothetical protein [Arthrobacter sp. Leaf69]|uniref:hypothetical protein n=1 Tax=Arthrobacter sp. Leaf69 TaxID=1736232 RepID=UPI0006FE6ECB|nr:hypothetical protein [Arthrobacter sp. Leaf69]KQN95083.1 hypothetical protein ASE96_02530 [Arthrobacter sp. Leaf69]